MIADLHVVIMKIGHSRGFQTEPSALLGMAERPDSTASLGQIAVPTLVITGVEDVLIPPAESEKLAKAIPLAQLSVIPHAGHLVSFEQADAFNFVLKNWLINSDLASPVEIN